MLHYAEFEMMKYSIKYSSIVLDIQMGRVDVQTLEQENTNWVSDP